MMMIMLPSIPFDFLIFFWRQRLLHIKWRLSAGRAQIKSEFGFLRPQLHLFKFNFILAALTCAFITAGMAYKVDLKASIKAGQRKSISPKRSAFELRICEHVPGASAIHSAQASKQLT